MSHSHAVKGHGHQHHAPEKYNLAFALSVSLNLTFVVVEAIYAVSANSMSLLADAGHNLGDVVGLLLAWGANWLLTRNSSDRYSYGYKKTTILAALFNALLLVATSAIIVYESISKLLHPVPIEEHIVIIVALVGIFINGGTALLFIKGSGDDLNIRGAFLHLATDALISLGVVLAGVVILLTQWVWLDPVVGLFIVLAILIGTWGLLMDSVNLLLAAVPRHVDHTKVRAYFCSFPGVTGFHDLHIWGLSTRETALTVHLEIPDGNLSDADHQTIQQNLLEQFKIQHATIQVDRGDSGGPCPQADHCKC